MKKILAYILFLVFLCVVIPVIFAKGKSKIVDVVAEENIDKEEKNKNKETTENKKESVISNYDYKKYNKVKLLHISTNKIEEIGLDEYMCGVVASEMPASFEEEALKAQAVVARTYTIYKIVNNDNKHNGADICDDYKCCQAWISKKERFEKWKEEEREIYWSKIVNAVNSTKGKIITYNNSPINAFFHANSGGVTEQPVNVWGGSGYPYLKTVVTSGEEAYTQYSSEVNLTKKEFEEKMQQYHSDFNIKYDEKDCIKIEEYTEGNRVKTIKIGNLELSGVEVRNILGLKSANFNIDVGENNIVFKVIGYGHGVGMSQTGADSLAKQGKSYEEIIKHYYDNVKIENI